MDVPEECFAKLNKSIIEEAKLFKVIPSLVEIRMLFRA